jgi:spore coat polysaccharide biosynthesis protein SpsF
MGSSRLPGKVLADVTGRPLLARVVERLRPSRSLDELVVATTTFPSDDAVVALADELGVASFRGNEEDCLDRYYRAASSYDAEVVVRLTGDNPVIDPRLVDDIVAGFVAKPEIDYASTVLSGTFPLGLGVEAFAAAALEAAWREAVDQSWREHVTPFFYKQPERFGIWAVRADPDASHVRLTVDTPEDLELVRRIFSHFPTADFTWRDAVEIVSSRPDWLELNRHVRQETV